MPKKKAPSKGTRARVRNPPTLKDCRVAVIGLNAVGRNIALLLTSYGIRTLRLVDHRNVTKRMQLVEGYSSDEVGRKKAHAVAQACHEINPTMDIITHTTRSEPDLSGADVVFVCGNTNTHYNGGAALNRMTRVHIVFTGPAGSSVRIRCGSEPRRVRTQSKPNGRIRPANACIVAGVAVRYFTKWLAGESDRGTKRINVAGLTIRIRVQS